LEQQALQVQQKPFQVLVQEHQPLQVQVLQVQLLQLVLMPSQAVQVLQVQQQPFQGLFQQVWIQEQQLFLLELEPMLKMVIRYPKKLMLKGQMSKSEVMNQIMLRKINLERIFVVIRINYI